MSRACILQNTLVSLPTGLGKTLIAAVVMYNFYRWFPTGKVVFCAPTRPLVSQQIHACYKIMGIPEHHTAEISGRTKPESREAMWERKRVFFCTPQTLVRDIAGGRCDAERIVCVVMDEAHRATGEHANAVLARLIGRAGGGACRLVGLSATPGTDIKSIQAVLDTLNTSRIECRTEDDPDVKRYIHHREEEVIVVKQPDVIKSLDGKFSELMAPILARLREERVSYHLRYDSANLKPYSVMQAQTEYQQRTGDYRLNSQFNVLRELANARQILKQHGVQMAGTKLEESTRKSYMAHTARQPAFQSLLRDVVAATGAGDGGAGAEGPPRNNFENNPKLTTLAEVLVEHFERKRAIDRSTRVIVFSQWRESVGGIVSMLTSQNAPSIKPAQFIGQARQKSNIGKGKAGSANSNAGKDAAGMNQKQQQRVLQQFSEGIYNVLVCTCVGEEGLDIGEVDLIVNFDVMKSPIRSIQRSGRTGRKRNGRVVFLVAEGQEERSYQQSVTNTKKIARALSNPAVFKLRPNNPLFPAEPNLMRKKMNVTSFHLSQVGGHTPKARRRSNDGPKGTKKKCDPTKAVEGDWRLNSAREEERRNLFGRLPLSPCRPYENRSNEFPPSLRRKYLNSRRQSTRARMLLTGKEPQPTIVGVGKSLTILQELEKMYCRRSMRGKIDLSRRDGRRTSSDGKTRERSVREVTVGDDGQEGHASVDKVSGDIGGNMQNPVEVESIDSDGDCKSMDFGSDQSVVCDQNNGDSKFNLNHPADGLDGTFGLIVEDERPNPSQMASLFDEAHHKRCAVIAPPGMTLDESDEETESSESASSTLSEMSTNDDICAFFEKDNSSDFIVDSFRKSNEEGERSATKILSSDDDHFDFGTPREMNCEHEDEAGNSIQVDDASKIIDGGKHTGGQDVCSATHADATSPNQTTDKEEEPTCLVCEKENINTQLSLSPACQDDQSSAATEECRSHQSPDGKVECVGSHMPLGNAKAETADKRFDTSVQLNEKNAECVNQFHSNEPILEEVQIRAVASFHLPTPPPSSDESDDDCSDSGSAQQNERLMRDNVFKKNESPCEQFNDFIADVSEETGSSKAVSFFQLPSQYSSSSEEDDGYNDNTESNEHTSDNVCATNDSSLLPHTPLEGMAVENHVSEETGSSKAVSFFQLPPQYSSSSEDDDVDNENTESNKHTHDNVCATNNSSLLPHTPMEGMVDIATACDNTHGSLKKLSPPDQCLADTPESRRVNFKLTSAAQALTDTPVKASFPVNDTKESGTNSRLSLDSLIDTPPQCYKYGGQQQKSLDSLTDTPLQFRKNAGQQRESCDILTDTPLQCQNNVGQQRKRLRPAPKINDNSKNPEARTTEKLQRRDRIKNRLEDKYRCRFLDCEAANDDSEDSDEEYAIKQIENEEISQDSFINNTSQLGYTQDELDRVNADTEIEEIEGACNHGEESVLHRQFNHQHDMDSQFKTPVFNRRMRNPASESQYSESSQKGLGNMNFIRSVLEHAAGGGDADQLEEEYHQLAGNNQSQNVNNELNFDSPMQPRQPSNNLGMGSQSGCRIGTTTTNSRSLIQVGLGSQQQATSAFMQSAPTVSSTITTSKPVVLTSEQRAMIEAKRIEALKRRQQKMQQKATLSNPYAK